MYSRNTYEKIYINSPALTQLIETIVVDYLIGKLIWFPYKNETYIAQACRIIRKSDGKKILLPTTGSELGVWDPRNEQFEDPDENEDEYIAVVDYMKTVKGNFFYTALEFDQARDEYRQLQIEENSEVE